MISHALRWGLAVVIGLASVALTFKQASAAPLTMIGSAAESVEFMQLQQPFVSRQLASKAADGMVQITLQPASANLDGKQLLARLRGSKLDIAAISAAQWRGIDGTLEIAELAGLAFDLPRARALADALRPNLERTLSVSHKLKLLALASAQAQVLYCRTAFKSIADIKGRRVRADGALLAGLVDALGATAVPMAAAAVPSALRAGGIDCAVGGTMQGNDARWYEHSAYLYSLPLAWTMTLYLVDDGNWVRMEGARRQALQSEFRAFETRVWDSNVIYTREGINCNAGVEPCKGGARGKMNIVIGSDSDRALLQRLSNDVVLPQWSQRCGTGCAAWFNEGIAKLAGVRPLK